jgi:hypothetical protein
VKRKEEEVWVGREEVEEWCTAHQTKLRHVEADVKKVLGREGSSRLI